MSGIIKIILVILMGLLSGCATIRNTIVDGHPNRKKVTIPSSISLYETTICLKKGQMIPSAGVENVGNTQLSVHRGDGVFNPNLLAFENSKNRIIIPWSNARINPWIFGNVIYGGFLGILVDGLTGAMWEPEVPVFLTVPASLTVPVFLRE